MNIYVVFISNSPLNKRVKQSSNYKIKINVKETSPSFSTQYSKIITPESSNATNATSISGLPTKDNKDLDINICILKSLDNDVQYTGFKKYHFLQNQLNIHQSLHQSLQKPIFPIILPILLHPLYPIYC